MSWHDFWFGRKLYQLFLEPSAIIWW
jgi:hypothetical protein